VERREEEDRMLERPLDLDEEDFCLGFELALGLGFAAGARTVGRRTFGETMERGTEGR